MIVRYRALPDLGRGRVVDGNRRMLCGIVDDPYGRGVAVRERVAFRMGLIF